MIYQGNKPWMRNNNFFISCYHNGLVTSKMREEAAKDLRENFSETKEDSYIKIHTKNHSFVLGITNDALLNLLEGKSVKIKSN
jgi:hypothetical protein